eukprot:jgi/Mesen1/6877/ME000353S05906
MQRAGGRGGGGGRAGRGAAADLLRSFIVRARVLALYRDALRTARKAPPGALGELRAQMRGEIERQRGQTDPQAVRFLVSEGLQRLKELKDMLSLQGHS